MLITLNSQDLIFLFSPLAATHFFVSELREFGVRSRLPTNLSDKFEYTHNMLAG